MADATKRVLAEIKTVPSLWLLAALSLLFWAGCQRKAAVSGAKVTEVGIYEAQVITAQTNAAGVKLQDLDQFKLLKNTTNVPARMGIRFGFRYEILGTPANEPISLTMVGIHPPIRNSVTGRTETRNVYSLRSRVGSAYTSYSLDDASDLVPGPWTFEVWYAGKKLCEQCFLVMPDSQSSNLNSKVH
jgi:hypothetical protein